MSITENRDGTLRFDYELDVNPCIRCGGTSINLYENGGSLAHEFIKGTCTGGGICKQCGHTITVSGIPPVPSMTMLLEVWNEHNQKAVKRSLIVDDYFGNIPIRVDPVIDKEVENYFGSIPVASTVIHTNPRIHKKHG